MDRRKEFVVVATQEGANRAARSRHDGIDPKPGRQWIRRYLEGGLAALTDRSRRPHHSPRQTAPAVDAAVVTVRTAHPTWGGRKLHAWLQDRADPPAPPHPSTITGILHRHDLIDPQQVHPAATRRFARAAPNELWQLDFTGHHARRQGRVHPLSVLDDHARFALGLFACAHERGELVQQHLITCFEAYGLPEAILADNGGPWGASPGDR